MTTSPATLHFTRAWRYEGYESGIEESLILIDGEQIGGAYFCQYNPAQSAGWGHNDGNLTGESWASYGPRGLSCGHPTREAAEEAQLREYATNPDLYDRLNAQDRAEQAAEQAEREAEREAHIAELDERDRKRRLGDDEPGPTIWTLPAYHVLYAPLAEVDAVSAWFVENGVDNVVATADVRIEQRASRQAIVYETTKNGFRGRNSETETRVVTLVTDPPGVTSPRPDLHELLEAHWPVKFPLIDFGQRTACALCTHQAAAKTAPDMVLWPCPEVREAIG